MNYEFPIAISLSFGLLILPLFHGCLFSTPASAAHLLPKLPFVSMAMSTTISSLLPHPVFLCCANDSLLFLKRPFRLRKNKDCNSGCDGRQELGKIRPYHPPSPFLRACRGFRTIFHRGAYQSF